MSQASEIVLQQRLVAKRRRLLREAEAKLRALRWQHHKRVMKPVSSSGVPDEDDQK